MPLTQLPCDVSQLQAGREAVQSVFSYAAVLKCTTCLSWLPNLSTWYTEAFHTPGVILEIVVDLDTFILALKTRECRNQLFGRRCLSRHLFPSRMASFKHQCLHSAWRCPVSHWHLLNTYGVCTMLSIHLPSPPPHTFWSTPCIHPRTWPLD